MRKEWRVFVVRRHMQMVGEGRQTRGSREVSESSELTRGAGRWMPQFSGHNKRIQSTRLTSSRSHLINVKSWLANLSLFAENGMLIRSAKEYYNYYRELAVIS